MADDPEREETRKEKEEREEKERVEIIIKAICETFERIMHRQVYFEDPVMRNTLLVDKLCLLVDGLTLPLTLLADKYKIDPELVERSKACMENLNKQLYILFEWINSPHYSPDHPFGHKMVKEGEKAFKEHPN